MNYLQRNCIQLREQSAGDEDLRGEAGALVKPVCWGSEIQSIKGTLYKNEHAHPIPTPFAQTIHLPAEHHLNPTSSSSNLSIYLEKFPLKCDAAFLHKIASKFVKIFNVYVARKLNKGGKRFAFIRVYTLSDLHILIRTLNFGSTPTS